jgi:hypothetical protein
MVPLLRVLVCSIGALALAFGFVFLNYDITKTLDGGVRTTKVGDAWYAIHATSLQLLQPAIERHVAEWLWDPVILTILTAPAWLVFGILGAILMLIGRRKSG